MSSISLSDILEMDQSYRRNFINALSGIKSAQLIGTANAEGHTNLAIFNSVLHIGASPPLMALLVRPHSVARHTYENICATQYFTINCITEDLLERAHQCSAKYEAHVSEFDACHIPSSSSTIHPAPYVKESPIKIGLQLQEEQLIKSNNTILVIGKIVEILMDKEFIAKDGHLLLDKASLVNVNGLDRYYRSQFIKEMPYARP